MLHCPLRSCFSASSRLDGGERKSSSDVAALSWVNRRAARSRISGGSRRDLPVAKKRSVSVEAKERITGPDYKRFVYEGSILAASGHQAPGLVVEESLLDLLLGVHHERPVGYRRLVDRLAAEQQPAKILLGRD